MERARVCEQRGEADADPRAELGGSDLETIGDLVQKRPDSRRDLGKKSLGRDDVRLGAGVRIQSTVVDPIANPPVLSIVDRLRSGVAAVEPRTRVISPPRVRGLSGRLVKAVHRIHGRSHAVRLNGPLRKGGFDLRHEQHVRTLACDVEKIRAVKKRRGFGQHTLLYVTPEVRRRLARGVEEDVAVLALRDLVAPSLERFAKDRGQPDAHEVEGREYLNGANVGRRRVLCREREPARQGNRDARIAEDEMRLRLGSYGPRLPEGASGIRSRTVGIDGPVPVADEIVKTSVVSLHVENELEKTGRPLSEAAIPGIAI